MSYDISFKVKAEGTDCWIDVGNCQANITWNLGEMIRKSTRLEWNNEANNGLCKDIIPCILKGLRNLENYPTHYKKYEAENGWGTIEGCKHFFEQIIKCWNNYCQEMIWDNNKKVIDVTTFWIE